VTLQFPKIRQAASAVSAGSNIDFQAECDRNMASVRGRAATYHDENLTNCRA